MPLQGVRSTDYLIHVPKEQEFNHLGVFRRGARLCAPTYEQFVGFI